MNGGLTSSNCDICATPSPSNIPQFQRGGRNQALAKPRGPVSGLAHLLMESKQTALNKYPRGTPLFPSSSFSFFLFNLLYPAEGRARSKESGRKPASERKRNQMDLPLVIGLASAALALSLALLFLAYVAIFRGYRIPCFGGCRHPDDLELGHAGARVADGPDPEPETEPVKGEAAPRRFGWPEIESLTGEFSSSAVIGEGGSSTVYLAALPSPTTSLVALKVLRSSERLHRAFRLELDVLLRLRHPHIVRLLGFCDDREEGVLVFEYVPNGTLHEKLHGGAATVLPWARRVAIAYQVAQALDYLHERCDLQIVHGDIKASNVLLGESLDAKLCDLGCARMGFSAAVQPPSTRSAHPMMGSPGYVDPHYLRSGAVSKKNDVYSFGVLLLELITGMEAFCSEREQLLTAVMGPALRDAGKGAGEMVDPRLNGEYDTEEASAMAALAALCVGENPSLRPSMAEVLRVMSEKAPSSISAVDSKSNGKPDL